MTNGHNDQQAIQKIKQQIQSSWSGWLQALDGIPAERLDDPGAVGEWSVKDLLGHVAFWDEQAVSKARRRMAGEPDRKRDWQAMNEREAAARKERSVETLWTEMTEAHDEVVSMLNAASGLDEAVGSAIRDLIQGDTNEHYDEHAAEVRAWRDRMKL